MTTQEKVPQANRRRWERRVGLGIDACKGARDGRRLRHVRTLGGLNVLYKNVADGLVGSGSGSHPIDGWTPRRVRAGFGLKRHRQWWVVVAAGHVYTHVSVFLLVDPANKPAGLRISRGAID
ncbi:MAG: hypothetical protein Rubg2KO_09600 [Rubricoccaceae bacterium]